MARPCRAPMKRAVMIATMRGEAAGASTASPAGAKRRPTKRQALKRVLLKRPTMISKGTSSRRTVRNSRHARGSSTRAAKP
ncbi:hypothetical protein D3C86_1647510 [compost metagenome]